MAKIVFMGAGSSVFVKNVVGDCLLSPVMRDSEFALYDIDPARLDDSYRMLQALNRAMGCHAVFRPYLGVENRRAALENADYVVNAIQVGFYEPCTVTDFEVPKKYGLRQTIGDTLGIGGIFRALRTIPVLQDFADDMMAVCPDAYFLNYTNPMAMLTGYMQRCTPVKTIGLCHSVQVCAKRLMEGLDMPYDPSISTVIAGINHQAWLLEIRDREGRDLYPEIKRRALARTDRHPDMVRYEIMRRFGYYTTESSEHNAEYMPFFIKDKYPELIDRFNIPLDEYPRRCVRNIEKWAAQRDELINNPNLRHEMSREYASHIMEAMDTNVPYKIGGNVINHGVIPNLPDNACVEVPCLVDGSGVTPCYVGSLPEQCAALNRACINVQLLTIEAAVTRRKETIYQAAMMDPHLQSELSIDDIVALCDDMIAAHGSWLPEYH
ncbi:MAG: alpha-glucosidase/alpha-galactosidase [Aristaeellaceae bacterium]